MMRKWKDSWCCGIQASSSGHKVKSLREGKISKVSATRALMARADHLLGNECVATNEQDVLLLMSRACYY